MVAAQVLLGIGPVCIVDMFDEGEVGVESRVVEVPRRVGKEGSVMSVRPKSW